MRNQVHDRQGPRRVGVITMLALSAFAIVSAGMALTSLPAMRRYLRMQRM